MKGKTKLVLNCQNVLNSTRKWNLDEDKGLQRNKDLDLESKKLHIANYFTSNNIEELPIQFTTD